MAFMRPEINDKDLFLISDDLEEPVFCKYNGINLPVGEYSDDSEDEEVLAVFAEYPKLTEFEIIEVYWGVLHAPGYMDQTDYYLGDTVEDVAQQLLDAFFDMDDEYLDEDEKEDRAYLEALIEGEAV